MFNCSGREPFNGNREKSMRKSTLRLLAVAVTAIFIGAPALSALAAGGGGRPPPRPPPSSDTSTKSGKKKGKKTSAIELQRIAAGYHAAYTTIYDRHDYVSAIEQLKSLGYDDSADVANLM